MRKLYLTANSDVLFRDDGATFDTLVWHWTAPGPKPNNLQAVDPMTALRAALALPGPKIPVGVIGPREASKQELETAEDLGSRLADLGLPVLTGGLSGVMEAASRGAFEAGGLTIGLLPGEDWRTANAFVSLPLATGIGKARNAIIAQSARALIAVGGGYGTLTEIAYGLHFDKPVLTLGAAPVATGAQACRDIAETLERLAIALLHGAVAEMS